jgi:hypothetical protein
MLGHNISVVNLNNLPPRAGVFAVGSTVKVEARMGPGFNQPGGVAKVVSRKSMGHGDGVETVSKTKNGRSGHGVNGFC